MRPRVRCRPQGGGGVLGAFLSSPGTAQQLRLYLGATALGSTARRWISAPLATSIDEAPRWRLLDVERVGDDVCLDYAIDGGVAGPTAPWW